jgi:hypothetical protein
VEEEEKGCAGWLLPAHQYGCAPAVSAPFLKIKLQQNLKIQFLF